MRADTPAFRCIGQDFTKVQVVCTFKDLNLTVIRLQSDRAQDKNTDRNIRNTYRKVFIENSLWHLMLQVFFFNKYDYKFLLIDSNLVD